MDAHVSGRAQTEPLAALVAVVAVCLAVTVYAGVLTDLRPALGSERSVEEATAERVWAALGENGVFDGRSAGVSVPVSALPQGYYVSIDVTVVGEDGRLDHVASEQFDPGGDPADVDPPADSERIDRPVAVRTQPAEVLPGRLRVVVWE